MIEAQATWVLEGPDDSITFSPAGPYTITEKPKTAVDDRRDTYDYPLDDGAYVGDAYAGHRVWSFKGILVASSHADRNEKMQALAALVNSLRRADGLLKWTPSGFDPVQSTVRRMGSIDFSGGAGLHVPFSFSLIAGDPRVYSQTEHTSSVTVGTASYGSNLLSANQASLETSTAGWTARIAGTTITRSNTQAHVGSYSLRLEHTAGGGHVAAITTTGTGGVPTSGGDIYSASCYIRGTVARSVIISFVWYDAAGSAIDSVNGYGTVSTTGFVQVSAIGLVPVGVDFIAVDVLVLGVVPGEYYYVDDIRLQVVTYSGVDSIVNAGDSETRPKFVITGPANDPTITNVTTADALPLDTNIDALSDVTIDTAAREIYAGAALTDVSNLYSAKAAASPFPTLPPGTNSISMTAGSTSGATEIETRWRDAWMP